MKKKLRVTVSVTVSDDDEFSTEEQALAVCDGLQRILCYDEVALQSVESFTDGVSFEDTRSSVRFESEHG
ncbi:hypothetical protein G6N74_16085 [Mesorhizobium sp. CGMCC 1.15528]|uniref:Uncharacterized protein n=1 Tax=Mesorhizobium zhangyense TaxID=1776730 RepID=A0A7C9VEK8_9HYPH|nr:hypothetical protein [Mesorhizobium zhangyense]NGN42588.1 hypothetical protein [Mesorhizobium zhangyense]